MKREYYLAIDIGASSGRHIVGYEDDNILNLVSDLLKKFIVLITVF